jgi:hypothetical protein
MGVGEMYKKVEKLITIVPETKVKENPPVQRNLFSDTASVRSESPPVYGSDKVIQVAENKSIEKIILFYSDKTFVEFKPSS